MLFRRTVRCLWLLLLILAVPPPRAAVAQAAGVGTWAPLPATGALGPRWEHVAVWTGHETLIWGGRTDMTFFGDGAAYDPATATWRPLAKQGAPSPRAAPVAVWTGQELLIWGGQGCRSAQSPAASCGDGARYAPATDTWTPMATVGAPSARIGATGVWTGTELLVWGGAGANGYDNDGGRYDPATDTWHPLSTANAPTPRMGATAVWTETAMLVWGGEAFSDQQCGTCTSLGTGGRYSTATDTWQPITTVGAPSIRRGHTAVWTGSEMIVWGGEHVGHVYGDGAAYDPAADTWRMLPTDGAPGPRLDQVAVWTGSRMIVWGGIAAVGGEGGALYDPTMNRWSGMAPADISSPRALATAVWTGRAMLVWGGSRSLPTSALSDGASYEPTGVQDARYFPQTGYRVDNATIWDYFQRRGGVPTFGYPTSRTFLFQGFTVQFFQRRIVQLGPDGQARLLNLLDPGLLPYTSFNGSIFPGVDSGLVSTAPSPTDQPAVLAWVQQHAPDTVGGNTTNFYHTFSTTVSAQTAFPNGGDAALLPGIDLELWGIPTSQPMMDANNHHFIYLRWQRGIMMYDANCKPRRRMGYIFREYPWRLLSTRTGRRQRVSLW